MEASAERPGWASFRPPLDRSRYAVEVVHLGNDPGRVAEAREAGVASVPALLLDAEVFHINFGAKLDDLG